MGSLLLNKSEDVLNTTASGSLCSIILLLFLCKRCFRSSFFANNRRHSEAFDDFQLFCTAVGRISQELHALIFVAKYSFKHLGVVDVCWRNMTKNDKLSQLVNQRMNFVSKVPFIALLRPTGIGIFLTSLIGISTP